MAVDRGPVRIGAFAQQVGVSPDLLRAWERRYGLLQPIRSSGGYRLYGPDDAVRVARMLSALEDGLSAAQAAQAAQAAGVAEAGSRGSGLENLRADFLSAIRRYDEAAVHARLDDALATFGLETVLGEVILPTLRRVGLEWEAGRLEIGHEHFASNVIRGRLLGMARLWGRGSGPLAVLACAPGDTHDLTLIAFGLLLRTYGWRILLLGASTPIETVAQTAASTRPDLTVLTSFTGAGLEASADELRRLASAAHLHLGGPGAPEAFCRRLGVPMLVGDIVAAAREIGTRERLPGG